MADAGETIIAAGDPTQTEDGTDITTTSTTYEAGSPVVGHAFTAPPSGIIWVNLYAWLEVTKTGAGARILYCGFELREGSVVGSGTVVVAADEERSVSVRNSMGTSGDATGGGVGLRYLVTGLTAGSSYNVRTMHKTGASSSNATHAVNARRISTEPFSN